jgi:mRNA-degrading endonuclease YafQ of YafQ-DinJ toxin-antitoxin module
LFSIIITEAYAKCAKRFLKKHPDLVVRYLKTLELLRTDPHHPSLRLYALSGKHAGVHSVSMNLSYRITMEFQIHEGTITPLNVGDHQAVY